MSKSYENSADGKILFVDKDDIMRQLMEMALESQFQIVTARSAEEALTLVESEGPFDIVISGFTLMWMDGVEFLRRVSDRCPLTVRILMSGGCGDTDEVSQAIRKGHISRLVLKPFCMSTFLNQLNIDLASVRTNVINNMSLQRQTVHTNIMREDACLTT